MSWDFHRSSQSPSPLFHRTDPALQFRLFATVPLKANEERVDLYQQETWKKISVPIAWPTWNAEIWLVRDQTDERICSLELRLDATYAKMLCTRLTTCAFRGEQTLATFLPLLSIYLSLLILQYLYSSVASYAYFITNKRQTNRVCLLLSPVFSQLDCKNWMREYAWKLLSCSV